jgi:hypothetical protein
MAIDTTVVLGLAGKASQVFEEPGTYLSFPLAPYGMEQARLRALVHDPLSAEGQQALAEFSLLVNEVPAGQFWQPDSTKRLWDVYGDVLDAVELAELPRTAEEQAGYDRAYALLYETAADDVVVDSQTVLAYEQHRDAYLAATQEYNNRKGQAELAADATVAQQWRVDEPTLREHIVEAEQDWATAGHRAEVEDARRLLRELGSRAPVMVWSGYRKLFDPDLPEIYFRTSVDGWAYLPTGYVPSDIVDVAWSTITVTRDELLVLAEQAPPELRSRLAGGSTDAAIQSVSFEYSALTVSRPWFAPEVFASRAWRFYEPDRYLSDGGTPPSGECTAYVGGLVLARNVAVRRRASEPGVDLGFLPTRPARVAGTLARAYPKSALLERLNARRAATARAVARTTTGHDRPAARNHRVRAIPGTVRDHRDTPQPGGRSVRVAAVAASLSRPEVSGAPRAEAVPVERVIRRVPAVRAGVKAVPVGEPAATSGPASSGAAITTSDPGDVYIIGFVCRLLPKAPDPDPSLGW